MKSNLKQRKLMRIERRLLNKLIICNFIFLLLIIACQRLDSDFSSSQDIKFLPMQKIELETLESFKSNGINWFIVGNVHSDYQSEGSMKVDDGSGILVNIPSTDQREDIYTKFEHGDIELKIDFLIPKSSESSIFFQGRYELQINDSWKVKNPTVTDVGGIFEPEYGTISDTISDYQGHAPEVNAGMAPGLWQTFHILFRAPRFDENGNKLENARFEWVDLNGRRIHEDLEVSGLTRAAAFEEEAKRGPLMIQGDHGPVAFKNFQYKKYDHDNYLKLGALQYQVYDYDGHRTPVDFDRLAVIDSGVTPDFNVSELSPKEQNFAIIFTGEVEVPFTGDYFFQWEINEGGHLSINGERVLENWGDGSSGQISNIIRLEKGTHPLELSYYQTRGRSNVSINYEGPGIETRPLGSFVPAPHEPSREPLEVKVGSEFPELIGSFVTYDGEKRPHILSVGHPEGIHYSYDLNRASVLTFWRGPFADVLLMWQVRGHQLLFPMNAAIKESAGIPIAQLKSDDFFENQKLRNELSVTEYQLNEYGRPVFISTYNGITLRDHIRPTDETAGFLRTLHYRLDEKRNRNGKVARIAQSTDIELLSNGLYRIDGRYYLDIIKNGGEAPVIYERDGLEVLYVPILRNGNESEVQYQLIW